MNSRRDLLIGAACLTGAAAAYGLVPRHRVSLLAAKARVEQIVPTAFDGWKSRSVSDLVAPKEEGSLAAKLYGETVGRIYSHDRIETEIMMLLAHGQTQSNDLQLHRPEICYPAFGFAITESNALQLTLLGGAMLPVRRLVAVAPDRQETILYWSRLGEYLPLDRKQQQLDRLRMAMKGDIGDGLLARFSVGGSDPKAAVTVLSAFIPALVESVASENRKVLIGTELSRKMAGGKV